MPSRMWHGAWDGLHGALRSACRRLSLVLDPAVRLLSSCASTAPSTPPTPRPTAPPRLATVIDLSSGVGNRSDIDAPIGINCPVSRVVVREGAVLPHAVPRDQ